MCHPRWNGLWHSQVCLRGAILLSASQLLLTPYTKVHLGRLLCTKYIRHNKTPSFIIIQHILDTEGMMAGTEAVWQQEQPTTRYMWCRHWEPVITDDTHLYPLTLTHQHFFLYYYHLFLVLSHLFIVPCDIFRAKISWYLLYIEAISRSRNV